MTHVLDDARGQMREGHTSAQWELIAREKVARTLLETGRFTADDLSDVNMPTEYRRHVHGAVTGFFAGVEAFMDFVGRQKSSRPSRKGGKNDLYRVNAKGLRELPGLLRDPHSRLYTLAGGSDEPASGASQLVAASSQDQEPTSGLDAQEARKGERDEVEQSLTAPSTGRGPFAVFRAVPHGAGPPNSVEPGGSSKPDTQEAGAGRGTGKSGDRSPITPPAAGVGSPGTLQLDIPHESESSAYGTIVDEAAA